MRLSQFISNCQQALAQHGDLEVIIAKDDEGNGYNGVYFSPSFGSYDGEDFIIADDVPEDNIEITHVCVN